MKTSYSKPLISLIRLPSESPKTRMKRADETTGARIVCVHRRVTRRHSRRASDRIERAGSGAAKRGASERTGAARGSAPVLTTPALRRLLGGHHRRQRGRDRLQVDLLERGRVVALLQSLGGVAGDDPAGRDQGDVLAQGLRLLEVMGGQQDRRTLLVQQPDVVPEIVAELDVDAGGRLVEDHQQRFVQEGPGEQQPALHAPGELRRPGVRLRSQVEDVDHLVGAAVGRFPIHPEVAAVVDERLPDGREAVEVGILLGNADQATRLHRVMLEAEHADPAAGRADQIADGVDQRRLAGPVRAEQAEELPGGNLQVELVEADGAVVVGLRECRDGQGRICRAHCF